MVDYPIKNHVTELFLVFILAPFVYGWVFRNQTIFHKTKDTALLLSLLIFYLYLSVKSTRSNAKKGTISARTRRGKFSGFKKISFSFPAISSCFLIVYCSIHACCMGNLSALLGLLHSVFKMMLHISWLCRRWDVANAVVLACEERESLFYEGYIF